VEYIGPLQIEEIMEHRELKQVAEGEEETMPKTNQEKVKPIPTQF
jgi:hypothetical protein